MRVPTCACVWLSYTGSLLYQPRDWLFPAFFVFVRDKPECVRIVSALVVIFTPVKWHIAHEFAQHFRSRTHSKHELSHVRSCQSVSVAINVSYHWQFNLVVNVLEFLCAVEASLLRTLECFVFYCFFAYWIIHMVHLVEDSNRKLIGRLTRFLVHFENCATSDKYSSRLNRNDWLKSIKFWFFLSFLLLLLCTTMLWLLLYIVHNKSI